MAENSSGFYNKATLWTLAIAAVLGLLFTVTLGLKLRRQHALTRAKLTAHVQEEALRVGDMVPPFHAFDLNGDPKSFQAGDSARFLGIVSPGCLICGDLVSEWWPRLTSDPRLASLSPAMLSLSTRTDVLTHFGPEARHGTFLADPPEGFHRAYRTNKIPLFIIVNARNEVIWLHAGTLHEKVYDALIRFTLQHT